MKIKNIVRYLCMAMVCTCLLGLGVATASVNALAKAAQPFLGAWEGVDNGKVDTDGLIEYHHMRISTDANGVMSIDMSYMSSYAKKTETTNEEGDSVERQFFTGTAKDNTIQDFAGKTRFELRNSQLKDVKTGVSYVRPQDKK